MHSNLRSACSLQAQQQLTEQQRALEQHVQQQRREQRQALKVGRHKFLVLTEGQCPSRERGVSIASPALPASKA